MVDLIRNVNGNLSHRAGGIGTDFGGSFELLEGVGTDLGLLGFVENSVEQLWSNLFCIDRIIPTGWLEAVQINA